jgi:adenylate cyclase
MNNKVLNRLESLQREVELSKMILVRKDFDLQTIFDVSKDMDSLRDTKDIMENLLKMVIGNFGALSGVVLLVDMNKDKIETIIQRGMEKILLDILSLAIESGFFKELQKVTGVQILSEGNNIQQKDVKKTFNLLSSFKVNIWIPFRVTEDLRGGIGLGVKISGSPYTEDDRDLLSSLANQGVLAIRNTKFMEQMKRDEMVRLNLAQYLSPRIVEKASMQNMQVNLSGDRRIVTVLYSNIRNLLKITEDRSPEQVILILNEYFTEMARIMFENKGSLDKYIGDAIMAVFGSLIPLENHPLNAVHASIKMMKRVAVLNEKWEKEHGFTMQAGIGIDCGEVFLGNIGSQEKMEFAAIGDTVNTASRLSELAQPGQIIITKTIFRSLDSDIKYVKFPPIEVRGKTQKLDVFEIVCS